MLVAHLFVVFLVVLIQLSGAVVSATTTHLLTHHLGEGAACLGHLESTLRLLCFFCLCLSLHSLNVRLPESAPWVGLPLGKVEHLKCFGSIEQLLAAATEQIDRVVHFDALIQDTGHDRLAIRRPLNVNGAVRAGLAHLLEAVEVPDVNLTLEVAKAADQEQLGEWTDSDRVAVSLAKLE